MSLLLYEVVRWGNDSDHPVTGGGNGPDTCYLVRAGSVEEAASLADTDLARQRPTRVRPYSSQVHLLGTDATTRSEARILRGPYIQHAHMHGWRYWSRDTQADPWVEHEPYEPTWWPKGVPRPR